MPNAIQIFDPESTRRLRRPGLCCPPRPGRSARGARLIFLSLTLAAAVVACERQAPPSAATSTAAVGSQPSMPPLPAAATPGSSAAAVGAGPAAPAGAGASASTTAGGAPLVPVTNELQHRPQSVTLPPPGSPTGTVAERDLAARERRLAEQQAALAAREAQLRHREGAQHGQSSRQATTKGGPAPETGAAQRAAASAPGTPGANGPFGTAGGSAPSGAGAGASGNAEDGVGDTGSGASEGTGAGTGRSAGADYPPSASGASAGSLMSAPEAAERARPATVPVGTRFEVEFTQGLASNTSSVGDTFRARLLTDVMVDGAVAIPGGSEILGVVTDAVAARRIGGQAKLSLKFTDLVLPSGSTVPVHASFLEEGKSKTGRDAATIGGSAAGGALLGRILGRGGRGTVLGALVGAAVGTAIASKTAGEEVVIPEGSVVKLKLDQSLDVKTRR
jgi:hypothetical protein